MTEDPDNFDENVDKFEDFPLVYLMADLVLPDEVGHVEEGNKFQF